MPATSPTVTAPSALSRLLLVTDRPEPHAPRDVRIRRYRLARLQLDAARDERFAHLRRSYD